MRRLPRCHVVEEEEVVEVDEEDEEEVEAAEEFGDCSFGSHPLLVPPTASVLVLSALPLSEGAQPEEEKEEEEEEEEDGGELKSFP
jgi:hypothetical protein